MKKMILFLPVFLLLAGCDAPQRTRLMSTEGYQDPLGDKNGGFTPGNLGDNGGNGSGNGGSYNPTPTDPAFANCDLTQKYHTIDIGYFGICQGTQDERQIKFNPSLTSQNVRVCLIPTTKEADGRSTYIGMPQCTYTQTNKIITGSLPKDRPGFTNAPLNGLMVMKEPLVPEYIACMQGFTNWPRNVCPNGATTSYCAYWIPNCPNGAQTPNPQVSCAQEAQNYMANLCNTFKAKYSNSYIDIRLK